MRNWSLKVKVGAYAAALTVLSLVVTACALLPFVYYHQLSDLDRELTQNAEELFRDLQNFRGAPVNPRHPLSAKFIPVALQERHLTLEGPEGQILYQSPSLDGADIRAAAPGLRTALVGGRRCRLGTFHRGNYTIHLGTTLEAIDGFQGDLRTGLLFALPAVGTVVFLGGLWLGRRTVAPVSAITRAAERISAERLSERLPVPPSRDEIARLSEVLNQTFDRLQQAYEAATRFSADASHQLKTPVAVLRAGLEELRATMAPGTDERPQVDQLLQQTRRLTTLIEDLLLLAQADAGRLVLESEPIDLVPLTEAAIDDLDTLSSGRLTIERHLPDSLMAPADRRRISLILQCLVENAARYTPDGGRVRVRLARDTGTATLAIANTGAPIPEEDRATIFERFRRGRAVGENVRGHGLGLNIARALARAHGGDLTLSPSDGQWTEFELRIAAPPKAGHPGA